MTIYTYLDLSRSHLTPATANRLDQLRPSDRLDLLLAWGWPAMTIAPYDNGWFVTVPGNLVGADNVPDDLQEVLAYAQRLGIHLLRFDSDGDEIDGLPTYQW